MMYYWLSDFVGDEDGYWEEYLNMVLEKQIVKNFIKQEMV